ncbi:unnamed protein product [Brugia pahangi]|uniref:Uncharacterized protein n=1 Tax=Brugia pahangi TaxID=6280 RepID=A0A0N4TJF9_BRUPA|nr:unnamed protein product [Brugia pahangi]
MVAGTGDIGCGERGMKWQFQMLPVLREFDFTKEWLQLLIKETDPFSGAHMITAVFLTDEGKSRSNSISLAFCGYASDVVSAFRMSFQSLQTRYILFSEKLYASLSVSKRDTLFTLAASGVMRSQLIKC